MYERFSDHARNAMTEANYAARKMFHEYIGSEHILMGLLKQTDCRAAKIIRHFLGNASDTILTKVLGSVQTGPSDTPIPDKIPQSGRSKQIIEYTLEEACGLHQNYVGTEHLLLGLLRDEGGIAGIVLRECGLSAEAVRVHLKPSALQGIAAECGTKVSQLSEGCYAISCGTDRSAASLWQAAKMTATSLNLEVIIIQGKPLS